MATGDAATLPALTAEQLEVFPDPVFATDTRGRLVHWSAHAEAALGWPREFAVGSSCPLLIDGAGLGGEGVCHQPCVFAASTRDAARGTGGPAPHPDLVVTGPHGRTFRASVVAFPAMVDGAPALVHVLRDRGLEGHDPLTGCLTRIPLLARFAEEQRRSERERSSLTLALIDVDDLARVNQRGGREAGDRVLAAFGSVLMRGFGGGLVARWEDDEFLALLPATSADAAADQLAALQQDLKQLPSLRETTFSSGVVEVAADAGFEASRREADAHLYKAKRRGGHRII